ncbi:MAG: AAA family ATPase [Nanoarchaeota archaeon]
MTETNKTGVSFSFYSGHYGLEEENRVLKESIGNLEKEIEKFKKGPLVICEVKEVFEHKCVVRFPNGNEFLVDKTANCEQIFPGDSVVAEQKNLTVVGKVGTSKKFDVEKFVIIEKPKISWKNIGGLTFQEQEIKEIVELPLTNPELFKTIGIDPPKGILLHGPPGTGKTMLAKAVANSTNATFIQIVGSELVQKYIGEGAKLVKDIFQLAKEKAPSIVFIDEIDAIASVRVDIGTGGEREVQRTFMQLLAEIDGFKPLDNVKVIGCTNRKEILDKAIVRPGRLDRQIFVSLPKEEARLDILKIHTEKMNMDKINFEEIINLTNGFSGAELKSIATEAGYFAIRQNRTVVTQEDFLKAVEKIGRKETDQSFKKMFG